MAMAKRIIERFDHEFDLRHFDYMHPGAPAALRAALPQALPRESRVHRLGRADAADRRLRGRRGQHRDALQLSRRRPGEPFPRRVHGLGGPRTLRLDVGPARLLARDVRRAAAPAHRPPRRRARDPAGLLHGRQRRDRARRASPEAREPVDPERHRPLHSPRDAASAVRRRSRAITSSATRPTCCARSAPRRRTTAPSPTTSAST
jgi:hypothetical protein